MSVHFVGFVSLICYQ